MEKINKFSAKTVVLPIENVDTDQIIPARFLKVTSKVGIGKHLFADWRYDAAGNPKPDFILNRPEAAGAAVLVAGDNFGCGSSREHAPWALHDYGFRAVISTSIADIFRNNALKNGLLPIMVDAGVHAKLLASPGAPVTVSLEDQSVTLADGTHGPVPDRSVRALLPDERGRRARLPAVAGRRHQPVRGRAGSLRFNRDFAEALFHLGQRLGHRLAPAPERQQRVQARIPFQPCLHLGLTPQVVLGPAFLLDQRQLQGQRLGLLPLPPAIQRPAGRQAQAGLLECRLGRAAARSAAEACGFWPWFFRTCGYLSRALGLY